MTDSYLSQISQESLEVLQHFGAEAPYLLNQYACAVEDALIEQVRRAQKLEAELAVLKGEKAPAEIDGNTYLSRLRAEMFS